MGGLGTRASPSAGGSVGNSAGQSAGQSASPARITNTQVEGIDEGDIVKAHGDHLVVLRRGRLYTVALDGEHLRTLARVDVTPPGRRPAEWYDEMLIEGDTVIVLGYRYDDEDGVGSTQVVRFDLSREGRLRFREVLDVRSGDYYSSQNYATRLFGQTLVVYMPAPLLSEPLESGRQRVLVPSAREGRRPWRPIGDWSRIYRPSLRLNDEPTLHTVMFCDLSPADRGCRSVGVVASEARSFYVSQSAVYLWVTGDPDDRDDEGATPSRPRALGAPSLLYRFPLNGGPAGAVALRGGPIDQFSFHEAGDTLHVVLRAEAEGDAMWSSELTEGDLAVAHVSLSAFSQRVTEQPLARYTALTRPAARGTLHNRFVGERLVYGVGAGWRRALNDEGGGEVFVHALGTAETRTLALSHTVSRIEPLGRHALVVGDRGRDLHLTTLNLDGPGERVATLVEPRAAEAESRSHGFFFSPQGEARGVLGLPVRQGGRARWRQLVENAVSIRYYGLDALNLSALGALGARTEGGPSPDDRCVASCVDWYGNARPIFLGERIFALMGYELVEAMRDGERLRERQRIDLVAPFLAPTPQAGL